MSSVNQKEEHINLVNSDVPSIDFSQSENIDRDNFEESKIENDDFKKKPKVQKKMSDKNFEQSSQ